MDAGQPIIAPEHAGSKGCASALIDPVVNWWNSQSSVVRGFMTGGFCAALLAIALGLRQLIVSSKSSAYEQLPVTDGEQETIWQDKKEEEEKRPFLS